MKTTQNKILITGGNKGIGLALAEKFLYLNNKVIVVGRNENDLKKVKNNHPKIEIFKCDLTDKKEFENLIDFIKKEHLDLNILINNAGVQYNYLFNEDSQLENKIQQEININLLVPVKLTAALLPIIELNKNTAIVNISSALAFVPKIEASVYAASKSAIHTFSKSLRYQLQKTKVFEVIPPLVDTQMTKGRGVNKISTEQFSNEFIKNFRKNNYEINIGKAKLLRLINRVLPQLAHKIINK